MTLVVDASVALKWFVAEADTTHAIAILTGEEQVVAPTLVVAELCNAAWRLWRRGELLNAQVDVVARTAARTFSALASEVDLAERASEISLALDHPAYDCFYLALAEREAASLVTADRRLLERVHGTPWEGRVVALGAYGAAPGAAP